ncbi:hypothetical protein Zmor_027219 [Zophobas morio]|uniref:Uncharacterized protein n=1 Tax=Zophobas morio TaxID=2755281 RepID=A0AA38M363_9CUCU|nr:hypothetical protein Zmor_027219 [Zophobas morio]
MPARRPHAVEISKNSCLADSSWIQRGCCLRLLGCCRCGYCWLADGWSMAPHGLDYRRRLLFTFYYSALFLWAKRWSVTHVMALRSVIILSVVDAKMATIFRGFSSFAKILESQDYKVTLETS